MDQEKSYESVPLISSNPSSSSATTSINLSHNESSNLSSTLKSTISSSSIHLFLLTFNCGKNPNLFQKNNTLLNELAKKLPASPSSFFVFSFQEICSVLESLVDYEQVNSYLKNVTDILIEFLSEHYNLSFDKIASNFIGAIGLIVLSPFKDNFKNLTLNYGKFSTGYLFSSLKGSCGIRLSFNLNTTKNEKTILTFLACHLTANEGSLNWEKRNKDLQYIFNYLKFDDSFTSLIDDSHCFIMGDLNYRATANIFNINDIANINFNDLDIPNLPLNTILNLKNQYNNNLLDNYDQSFFNRKDELTISKNNNKILSNFDEPPINFKPTYKFIINSNEYTKKRIPSWCDRILYLSYQNNDNREVISSYDSVPNVHLSDHKPVYLDITIPNTPPLITVPLSLSSTIASTSSTRSIASIATTGTAGTTRSLSRPLTPYNNGYIQTASILNFTTDSIIGYALYAIETTKGRFFFGVFLLTILLISYFRSFFL
ncbi:phosphoinositide 5-phosphatase INP54 [Ascoidea rubescens DSM 1968]|uniref:DNase I-like protein n=1 Tax=Ascoidea rubescens DSM 1968 TaxID=1344418 RepID=A0A1D2VEU1_9ASCO|nr:DNase I-like protein [Ascoidea rubescens DSM 1968]ODV60023.1 DNase I-like protein [Ascoidea rubescens DSM 1968]